MWDTLYVYFLICLTSFSELVDISNMEDTEFLVEDLDSGGEHVPKPRNPEGGYH